MPFKDSSLGFFFSRNLLKLINYRNMVPISLMVTLEIVKFFQAFFI